LRSSTRASGCRTGSIAPSPTLYNNICSDGAFVTTISDSVEVTRPNEPATPMPAAGSTVFGMADPPYGVPKPLAVRWTAQRSLEITIPNGLSPGQAIAKGWRFASSGAHTNPMSLIGPSRPHRAATAAAAIGGEAVEPLKRRSYAEIRPTVERRQASRMNAD
jgi:hypothetical protein